VSRSLPTLRVDGSLEEALREERFRELDGEPLLGFVGPRRWFGAKGGGVTVRVRDVTPLFPTTAVARLVVERAEREPSVYQLPIAARAVEADSRAVIARVESRAGSAVLIDAMEDLEFLRELGRTFAEGRRFESKTTSWSISRAGRAFEEPRPVGAEQSNTSVFYGGAIMKLYRRLVVGEHPDVEIGEFLTARGFEHVPRLFGTMAFEDADGARSVAGVIQELVPAEGDGWSIALAAARDGRDFTSGARDIGSVTRALHEALASDPDAPAFAPRPLGNDEVERAGARVHRQIERAVTLLERRLATAPPSWMPLRERLGTIVARRRHASALVESSTRAFTKAPGAAIRHHGDYHLGQVLVGRSGRLVVVDFEGEPARPLSERRARASALRDVAGMLRSFSYAAGVAAMESKGPGPAGAWEDPARRAFLDAYFASSRRSSILPQTEESLDAALRLFELEKVFYELEYEIDNRPDWVGVPLAGIERLLA
jgi:maltokinase